MWVAKLRLKHEDCAIGRRCKRFNVVSMGIPGNSYKEGDKAYYTHFETLVGDQDKVTRFIEDLKEDPLIHNVEVQGNSIFFVNEALIQQKIPTITNNPKLFWVKPVMVDEKGYEDWYLGSWDEKALRDFVVELQKEHHDVKIEKIENKGLSDIDFPKVLPALTKGQKKALEIAKQHGYYDFPRKADLKELAAEAGISLSTFREHLRKAEKKVMPDLVRAAKTE